MKTSSKGLSRLVAIYISTEPSCHQSRCQTKPFSRTKDINAFASSGSRCKRTSFRCILDVLLQKRNRQLLNYTDTSLLTANMYEYYYICRSAISETAPNIYQLQELIPLPLRFYCKGTKAHFVEQTIRYLGFGVSYNSTTVFFVNLICEIY